MVGYIVFVEDEDSKAPKIEQMIHDIIQDHYLHWQNQIIVQRLRNVDELKKNHEELPDDAKIIYIVDLLMEGDNQPKHRIDADIAYIIQQRLRYAYFIIYSMFTITNYGTELQNVINQIAISDQSNRVAQLDRSQKETLKEYIIDFINNII